MTVNHAAEELRREARRMTEDARSIRATADDDRARAAKADIQADALDVVVANLTEAADTLERIHGSSACLHCGRPTAEPGCVEDSWVRRYDRDPATVPMAHVLKDGEMEARERGNILHGWKSAPGNMLACIFCPATKPAPLPGVQVYGVTGETLDPQGPVMPTQRTANHDTDGSQS